jgi:hypothetical protein
MFSGMMPLRMMPLRMMPFKLCHVDHTLSHRCSTLFRFSPCRARISMHTDTRLHNPISSDIMSADSAWTIQVIQYNVVFASPLFENDIVVFKLLSVILLPETNDDSRCVCDCACVCVCYCADSA